MLQNYTLHKQQFQHDFSTCAFYSMIIWAPFQLITSFKLMLKHVFLQICTISISITTNFTLVWTKVFIIFLMFSANIWLQTITRSCLIITRGGFKFQNWGFSFIKNIDPFQFFFQQRIFKRFLSFLKRAYSIKQFVNLV